MKGPLLGLIWMAVLVLGIRRSILWTFVVLVLEILSLSSVVVSVALLLVRNRWSG